MKPIVIIFFVMAIILSACTTMPNLWSNDTSTLTATISPITEPTIDKNVIGTWFDTWAKSAGTKYEFTIIIRNVNGTYQITKKFEDGSEGTDPIAIKVVNGEERLYEIPGDNFGDYMVIKSNGNFSKSRIAVIDR